MNEELNDLWQASKETKYRSTFSQLQDKCENAMDLNSMLYVILDTVVKASHAEAGSLWFYDFYGSGRIEPKVIFGGGDIHTMSLAYGEGIIGKVIKDNKGVLISDCQNDKNFYREADEQSGFTTKSMICVPIGKDAAFAGIQIINKTDGNLYDEKDYEFISSLAEEASKLFYKLSDKLLFGDKGENFVNKIEKFVLNNSKEDILKDLESGLTNKDYNPRSIRKILKYASKLIDNVNNSAIK